MNAFTIIKTGQEDKSVMQKEDLISGEIRIYWNMSRIARIGTNASFGRMENPQMDKIGLQGKFPSSLARSGYVADRTVFDHWRRWKLENSFQPTFRWEIVVWFRRKVSA